MLSEKMNQALNNQINKEMESANLYLSMSAYFETESFSGMASWMFNQYQEEMAHAMKLFKYVNDREGKVILESIEKPKSVWSNTLDVFEDTLTHEKFITKSISDLIDLAMEEKDHATNSLLQWFITEQVEEESTVSTIISQFKMLSESKESLYHIDKELGQRVFTPPAE